MPVYEYKCQDCEISEEHFRLMDNRDELPSCSMCHTSMQRQIGAPMVMEASLPMGVRRKDKGYQELKAAAKLDVQRSSMNKSSAEYRETTAAIAKLKTLKP